MSEKEVKNIDLELKSDAEGKVSAVFSVFNSLDSDGDIVLPGSIKSGFKSGSVPMVWAHKWDMPIGKGSIDSDGEKATFSGEFFMDTESGKEAYKIVKNMADMQQWSFGYRVNDAERGKIGEGDEEKDARFLKDLTVFEVSPVLVGANQDTYTMAIKSNEELLKEIVGTDEEKAVLSSSSFGKEPVSETLNEEDAVKPEVEVEEVDKEKSVTVKELLENPTIYLKELYKLKEAQLETQEEISENAPKAFSEQVKDVLAALNDLMVRATAIAMLRAKDGRKLGEKATEALRAVQEDLQDAWVELDQFIDNVGENTVVTEESVDVEEELPADEVEDVSVEEPAEEVEDSEEEESAEEVEVESDPETEPVEAEDNTESVNDEDEALWLEAQQNIAESLDAELEVEDNI
jgi:HK97 family phage prohead protease